MDGLCKEHPTEHMFIQVFDKGDQENWDCFLDIINNRDCPCNLGLKAKEILREFVNTSRKHINNLCFKVRGFDMALIHLVVEKLNFCDILDMFFDNKLVDVNVRATEDGEGAGGLILELAQSTAFLQKFLSNPSVKILRDPIMHIPHVIITSFDRYNAVEMLEELVKHEPNRPELNPYFVCLAAITLEKNIEIFKTFLDMLKKKLGVDWYPTLAR